MKGPARVRVEDIADAILAAQGQSGAFASVVARGDRRIEDRNGFITALVVRALGHGPLPQRLNKGRECALDYLERCERTSAPGTFGFWPEDDRPWWAPSLPADADDTAVMALELYRAGRRSPEWLRDMALRNLLPYRVEEVDRERDDGPAWVRPGVFRTWLAPRLPNPVDCVVNVNVAAVLAVAGLTHIAAYRAVVAMLGAALDWAGDAPARVATIAPFYAHPIELCRALAHAVASGGGDFEGARARVAGCLPPGDAPDPDQAVCCSAYGVTVWRSPVLQMVRRARAGARREDAGAEAGGPQRPARPVRR